MLSCSDNNPIIRFHKLRENENTYIDEKIIEGFKEPVLIEKI